MVHRLPEMIVNRTIMARYGVEMIRQELTFIEPKPMPRSSNEEEE